MATELAKEYNARLHILHISTEQEIELFTNSIPLEEKRITAEVCVHHLSFNDTHYPEKQSLIKCNPAIKSEKDQTALWHALNNDYFDIISNNKFILGIKNILKHDPYVIGCCCGSTPMHIKILKKQKLEQ